MKVIIGSSDVAKVYRSIRSVYLDKVKDRYIGVTAWARTESGEIVGWLSISITTPPGGGGGGGCPWLYVWDGNDFKPENNLLPLGFNTSDVNDYYVIENVRPSTEGDVVRLAISESEYEEDYIDQVKLYMVVHGQGTSVAALIDGRVIAYNPEAVARPIRALLNDYPEAVSSRLSRKLSYNDSIYLDILPGDYVTVYFGNVSELGYHSDVKLILKTDINYKYSLIVQMLMEEGWTNVTIVKPREKWHVEAVDLSGRLPDVEGEYKVRLLATQQHKIDFTWLCFESLPAVKIPLPMFNATLVTENGSENVLWRLVFDDNVKVKLVPGDQLHMEFYTLIDEGLLEDLGLVADYMVKVNGYYKSLGDPTTTHDGVESTISSDGWSPLFAYAYIPTDAEDVKIVVNFEDGQEGQVVYVDEIWVGLLMSDGDYDTEAEYDFSLGETSILYDGITGSSSVEFFMATIAFADSDFQVGRIDDQVSIGRPEGSSPPYLMHFDMAMQWNDKNSSATWGYFLDDGDDVRKTLMGWLSMASDAVTAISLAAAIVPGGQKSALP